LNSDSAAVTAVAAPPPPAAAVVDAPAAAVVGVAAGAAVVTAAAGAAVVDVDFLSDPQPAAIRVSAAARTATVAVFLRRGRAGDRRVIGLSSWSRFADYTDQAA
jgi:hypothetical protein